MVKNTISLEIHEKIRTLLKSRLQSIKESEINFKIRSGYKPYVEKLNDNLILDIYSSPYYLAYEKDLKDMHSLGSSAALTFNTFANIGKENPLIVQGTEFDKFAPEIKHSPLADTSHPAHIDAMFVSDAEALMIEMKMFEHYDKKHHRFNSKPYTDKNKYRMELNEPVKDAFVELFNSLETKIERREFTRYDVQQMAKHLLSIVNNRESSKFFETNIPICLLSVSWLVSRTDILQDDGDRNYMVNIDDGIEREAQKAVQLLNSVLDNLDIRDIRVQFINYVEFIKITNLKKCASYPYLQKRYL